MVEKTDFKWRFGFLSTNHDVFLIFLESRIIIIVPGEEGDGILKISMFMKNENTIF